MLERRTERAWRTRSSCRARASRARLVCLSVWPASNFPEETCRDCRNETNPEANLRHPAAELLSCLISVLFCWRCSEQEGEEKAGQGHMVRAVAHAAGMGAEGETVIPQPRLLRPTEITPR